MLLLHSQAMYTFSFFLPYILPLALFHNRLINLIIEASAFDMHNI